MLAKLGGRGKAPGFSLAEFIIVVSITVLIGSAWLDAKTTKTSSPQYNQDIFDKEYNECMDKLTVRDGKSVKACRHHAMMQETMKRKKQDNN